MTGDVVVVIHTWFPNHQVLFDKLQSQVPRCRLCYFVLSSTDKNRAWQAKTEGVVCPTVVPGIRLSFLSYQVNVNVGLSKYISAGKPVLVITKGWTDPAYFSAQKFARKRGIPFITWMCGRDRNVKNSSILRRLSTPLAKKAVASSRFVFAYGTQAGNDAIALGACPEDVIIVKHMIDDQHFDYKHCSLTAEAKRAFRNDLGLDDSPVFLCISQLVKRKGITDLLAAFDVLKRKKTPAQLLLIGKGPMHSFVERYASENPGYFRWIPSVPYEQIPSYYQISDCFVFPTHFDAWGTVVNESHWAKLPIICSDGAHASFDLIKHGHSGLVYPAGDVDMLTELMAHAAIHESEMSHLADNGYDFVASQWNLECSVNLWSRYMAVAIEEK